MVGQLVDAAISRFCTYANWGFVYGNDSYRANEAVLMRLGHPEWASSILDEHVFDQSIRHELPEAFDEPFLMRVARLRGVPFEHSLREFANALGPLGSAAF